MTLTFIKPNKLSLPVLVGVPHAGSEIPPECVDSFISQDPLLLTQDSDLFVDKLYAKSPEFGAMFVTTSICRYVIDCNRDPAEIDASFIEDAQPVAKPKHLGLIAHKTVSGKLLLKKPLSRMELERRRKLYHEPFHTTTCEALNEIKKKFGFCINLEAHSMPSKGTVGHIDMDNTRADVVLGDCDGRSCSPKLTQFLKNHFESHGLTVSCNFPYKGGYVTQHYGHPSQNQHSILIELNRKLYMNETTHEIIPDQFASLEIIVDDLLQKIASLSL